MTRETRRPIFRLESPRRSEESGVHKSLQSVETDKTNLSGDGDVSVVSVRGTRKSTYEKSCRCHPGAWSRGIFDKSRARAHTRTRPAKSKRKAICISFSVPFRVSSRVQALVWQLWVHAFRRRSPDGIPIFSLIETRLGAGGAGGRGGGRGEGTVPGKWFRTISTRRTGREREKFVLKLETPSPR